VSAALEVLVVGTGIANLASVLAGLCRAGARPRLAVSAAEIAAAPAVLLPGVGAFDAGIQALERSGAARALRERIAEDRPTLAICLGLQLLLDGSAESADGRPGLGVIRGFADRFPDQVRVPQLGWNEVVPDPGCRLLAPGHAYFANSFRLPTRPPGAVCAIAAHGGPFVAAFERGNLLACQFHPELSGAYGGALLTRFVDHAMEVRR
jgi:imidazole glycerol phosphate synthase glutamine amidotransferase subunit